MSTPVPTSYIRRYVRKITANCSLLRALPNTTCPICMDDFICQEVLLILPICHHIFHPFCILPWFSRTNTCPLCRRVFPPEQQQQQQQQQRVRYSVLLRTHSPYLRQQPPFAQQPRDTIFRLNFHLRPPVPSPNSNRQRLATPLERILISEGFPQLALRACGPYWISGDSSSHNVPVPPHIDVPEN